MSSADVQYNALIQRILTEGYSAPTRAHWKNGAQAHAIKVFGHDFRFDLSKEFPILTQKKVFFETAIKEILWIMQGDNNVENLQKQGVHIWDEWMIEEPQPWMESGEEDKWLGSIGKAYGHQIKKYDQINKLIHNLKTNPQGRRHIVTLWNVEDLPAMSLQPCAFQTIWDVSDGRLNCQLIQRSADIFLGLPFNMVQYAALVHVIAHLTNLKPGVFWHTIANAHVYDRHVPLLEQQLTRTSFESPEIWINPGVSKFNEITYQDFRLRGYQSHPFIRGEVAV